MRVLLWAGCAAAAVPPSRRDVRARARRLRGRRRIACALDSRERPLHCHHEKLLGRRRPGRVRGRHRPHRRWPATGSTRPPTRRGRRSAGTTSATRIEGPAVADVARALRHALAGGDRRAAAPSRAAASRGRDDRAGRAHACPSGSTGRLPRGRVRDPRVVRARVPLGRAADLPGEPVPVVAGAGRACSPKSCETRPATTSGWWSCCRPGRTAAATTPAACSACCSRPTAAPAAAGLHASIARAGRTPGSDLRARQGRHRRRPLADRRLGEPERPLAVQRQRDERRQPRRRARRATRGCGCGRSTSSCRPSEIDGDPTRGDRRRLAAARRTRTARTCEHGRPLTHRLVQLPARVAALGPAAGPAAGPAGRRLSRQVYQPPRRAFTGNSQHSRVACEHGRRRYARRPTSARRGCWSWTTRRASPSWWRPCFATRDSRSRPPPTARAPCAPPRSFRPDLVVLDVMLPDCDGFEVYRRLSERTPRGAGAVPDRPRRRPPTACAG